MNTSILILLALGLALFATLQLWIFLLAQKKRQRQLFLHESGNIEIGFSALGPWVALRGVLRVTGKSAFVSGFELTLVDEKDKKQRDFSWIASRSGFLQSDASEWETPAGFLVSEDSPKRYHIVFGDLNRARASKDLLLRYNGVWSEAEIQISSLRKSQKNPAEIKNLTEEILQEFKRREICFQSYTELDKACFWEHGSYTLNLKVKMEDPESSIDKTFAFSLSKVDVKFLKSNSVYLLDEPIAKVLNLPIPSLQTVQLEYGHPDGISIKR